LQPVCFLFYAEFCPFSRYQNNFSYTEWLSGSLTGLTKMKIGSLVKARFDIEIGGKAGAIVGKIECGEMGIIIDSNTPFDKEQFYIQFNSSGAWWLTEDELELLSK